MSDYAIGLILAALSAVAAATSHAFLKSGQDKLAIRCWSSIICGACALPVAAWSGILPMQYWPLMIGFALLSFINQVTLVKSYQLNDFSLAYPVARGVVPLAMAILGIIFLGDTLSPIALAGIMAITLGILSLAFGKGMSRNGWGAALLVGLTTIGYNILAANGMRETQDAVNFLSWLFVTDGVLLPIWLMFAAKGTGPSRLVASWTLGWQGGLMTLFSFSALTYAMRLAPVGPVSAIRESSVLIALVLAAIMLKEHLDRWRVLAGMLISIGAIALVFG